MIKGIYKHNGFMKNQGILIIVMLLIGVIFPGFLSSTPPQDKKAVPLKDTVYIFQKHVLPLLQANCNPCHFPGGKVYKKLPFDDYKTVASLGKKLNTRLKQKKQQAVINGWIKSGTRERD